MIWDEHVIRRVALKIIMKIIIASEVTGRRSKGQQKKQRGDRINKTISLSG